MQLCTHFNIDNELYQNTAFMFANQNFIYKERSIALNTLHLQLVLYWKLIKGSHLKKWLQACNHMEISGPFDNLYSVMM